jgi:beta-glucosidase
MHTFSLQFLVVTALMVSPILAVAENHVQDAIKTATTPAHRMESEKKNWWQQRHEEKLALTKQGGWELVFLGDSITHAWENAGKQTWNQYYGKRKPLNLGFSGDRTEHVLWRLDNGELDGYQPKVVVIMIGTNNTGHRKDPPEAIAAGVEKIIDRIKTKSPETKVLLLAIFPRSEKPTDAPRVNNDKANTLLAKLADGDKVVFLDINERLLMPDGKLSKEIMPDLLHPKEKGYTIWGEAIEPTLKKMLGE